MVEENTYYYAVGEDKAGYHQHIDERRHHIFFKTEAKGSKYIENNTGPRIEPCGTPQPRGMSVEMQCPI